MEKKQRAGLYILPSLSAKIGLVAQKHKWSWNQAATELIERGYEAQSVEVDNLVTAARDALGELSRLSDHFYKLESALAPFEVKS